MKKLFNLLLLLVTITVQSQTMVGIIASQNSGGGTPAYARDFADIFISQQSLKQSPQSGMRSTGTDISEDGLFLIEVGDTPDYVHFYTMGSSFDLDELAIDGYYDVSPDGGNPSLQGIMYGDSDTKVYLADLGNDGIMSYTLSGAGDFGTASFVNDWNPPQSINELVFNIKPDGTSFQIAALNDATVTQYDTGTDWIMTGSVYDGSGELLNNATGKSNHYITYMDNVGDLFAYNDPSTGLTEEGGSRIRRGELATAYDFTSTITKDVEWSMDFFDMTDGMFGIKWHENDESFVSGGYGTDHFYKFRFLGDDTFTTGVDESKYYFDNVYGHQIITPLSFPTMSDDVSIVADMVIREGKGSVLNEIAGSYSSNYLRFYHTESTDRINVQFYDGTNSASAQASWVNDGLRHQFAAVLNSGTDVKLYVDGVEVEDNNDTDACDWSVVDNNQLMFVGARQNGTGFLGGEFYNFQVYDKELSPTEVSDLYTDITDVKTSLVLYLGDEKGDYFWKDESGNDYHGGVEGVQHIPYAEIGIQANAVNPYDEENKDLGWTAERSSTVTVDSDSYDGDYSIKVVSGASTYSYGEFYLSGIEIGESYEVKFWAKASTFNPSSKQQVQLSDTGWTVQIEIDIDSTDWTEYSAIREANSTTPRINARANRGVATVGQELWIDNITITKQ
jgi:hypothetical protein